MAAFAGTKKGPKPVAKMFHTNLFKPHWPIEECPHCGIQKPNLMFSGQAIGTITDDDRVSRVWGTYVCSSCAGVTLVERQTYVSHAGGENTVIGMRPTLYPPSQTLSEDIPERPAKFLLQAMSTLSQPDASVIVAASAVDAMLKHFGLTDGSLHRRIHQARERGMITQGMADWALEIKDMANDQRHADVDAPHATFEDAKRMVEFAKALAEFLFVLPARVTRGRTQRQNEPQPVQQPIQTTASLHTPPAPAPLSRG